MVLVLKLLYPASFAPIVTEESEARKALDVLGSSYRPLIGAVDALFLSNFYEAAPLGNIFYSFI